MASHSRLPVCLFVAALPLVALLQGCPAPGGQKPFHYQDLRLRQKPPELVEIRSDCHADPETARVEVDPEGGTKHPRAQVIWYVVDKQPGDRVVISGKPADQQNPKAGNGQAVRDLFQSEYEIQDTFDAIRSGPPSGALPLLAAGKDKVVWLYNIEYYRLNPTTGKSEKLCRYDPRVCVERQGSIVCYDA